MKSFGQVLDEHRGLGPGFDFLRVGLALAIVAIHTFMLTGNSDALNRSPFWFTKVGFVPMFFALSGFLITASGMRLSLKNFLMNRGMRIVPALAVDIAICALILGPIVTTVPLAQYFSDGRFWSYFLNIIGWVHYKLPGVFEYYPHSKVNGSLWTVPYEIICYIFISFLIFAKFLGSAAKVIFFTLAYWGMGCLLAYNGVVHDAGEADSALGILFVSNGARIVTAFLVGIVLYQLRAKIPYNWGLFAVSVAVIVATSAYVPKPYVEHIYYSAISLPALAYLTVFIGLTRVPIPSYFHRGDYSYGIYLYHYPMIHLVNITIPGATRIPILGSLIAYAIVVPIVLGIAYVSWHYIEKPTLALRKKFSFVAKVRGIDAAGPTTIPATGGEPATLAITNPTTVAP